MFDKFSYIKEVLVKDKYGYISNLRIPLNISFVASDNLTHQISIHQKHN